MAWPKGTPRPEGAGRKKGTPNKLTMEAREAIELAFEGAGGVATLTEWAKENPTPFYTAVWARIIPKDINVTGSFTIDNILTLLNSPQLPGALPLPPALESVIDDSEKQLGKTT